jgi:hypothetical protein
MNAQRSKVAGRRVLLTILPVVVFFVVANLFGLVKLAKVREGMRVVSEYHMPLLKTVARIDAYQHDQQRLLERLFCSTAHGPAGARETGRAAALASYERLSQDIESANDDASDLVHRAIESTEAVSRQAAFGDFARRITEMANAYRVVDQLAREAVVGMDELDAVRLRLVRDEIEAGQAAFAGRLERVLQEIGQLTEQEVREAQRAEEQAYLWMLIFTALAFSGFAAAYRALRAVCRD